MKRAAGILAGVGVVGAIVSAILVWLTFTADHGAFPFSVRFFVAAILAITVTVGALITALVLGLVSRTAGGGLRTGAGVSAPSVSSMPAPAAASMPAQGAMADPVTEQAVQTILALAGPSLQMTRTAPNVVKIQLVNVGDDNGRVIRPLSVRVYADIVMKFDGARRKVRYSGSWYEQSGLSVETEKVIGRVHRGVFGAYLTLDGVVTVSFNTMHVYRLTDQALASIGWR